MRGVLHRAPGCKVDYGKKTSCDGHCVRVNVLVNVDAGFLCVMVPLFLSIESFVLPLYNGYEIIHITSLISVMSCNHERFSRSIQNY
jgi:hypothetical protein